MDSKRMVEIAIESLTSFDANKIERVELESSEYDDGSTGFTIDIIFFADKSERK